MKSIFHNAIGGIIGTIIGGLFLAWLLAPSAPGSISAHEISLDFPIAGSLSAPDSNVENDFDSFMGTKGLAKWLADVSSQARISIYKITIENSGDTRSDSVELNAPQVRGYVINYESESPLRSSALVLNNGANNINLGRIEPGAKISVLLVGPYQYEEPSFHLTNGGRLISVQHDALNPLNTIGITSIIMEYAPLSEFGILLSFLLSIFLCALGSVLN